MERGTALATAADLGSSMGVSETGHGWAKEIAGRSAASRPANSSRENVILFGPPGVGKTYLAISLAIAAVHRGRRVYYGTLADLITSLEEAQAAGRLQNRLKVLAHPALLVVDEIGYLPISRTAAMLFFQM